MIRLRRRTFSLPGSARLSGTLCGRRRLQPDRLPVAKPADEFELTAHRSNESIERRQQHIAALLHSRDFVLSFVEPARHLHLGKSECPAQFTQRSLFLDQLSLPARNCSPLCERQTTDHLIERRAFFGGLNVQRLKCIGSDVVRIVGPLWRSTVYKTASWQHLFWSPAASKIASRLTSKANAARHTPAPIIRSARQTASARIQPQTRGRTEPSKPLHYALSIICF